MAGSGRKAPVKDFEKKVVKVGKIKKGAANATDTSFTAKKILVREQSISALLTTNSEPKQNLTLILKPILTNCNHYNVNIRKEALVNLQKQIKELPVNTDPSSGLLPHLDPILTSVFKLCVDDEAQVRNQLLFLLGYLFEAVPSSNLSTFFPRWISFMNLASSHIKPEIRKDSFKFVQMTLKFQEGLFLPQASSILMNLTPLVNNLALETNAKAKANNTLPFEVTSALLSALTRPYLELKKSTEKNLSKPIIQYAWEPVQKQPIQIIRSAPSSSTRTTNNSSSVLPPALPLNILKSITSHLTNLSITAWLDVAHLLTPQSTINRPSPAESRTFHHLLKLYSQLFYLAMINRNAHADLDKLTAAVNDSLDTFNPEDEDDDGFGFWNWTPARLWKCVGPQGKKLITHRMLKYLNNHE